MKNISIAVDLSKNSLAIAKQGVQFSKLLGIEKVNLVYAYEMSNDFIINGYGMPYSGLVQVDEKALEQRITTELNSMANEISTDEVCVEVQLLMGNPTEKIVEFTSKNESEYLVIGLKGHSFVEKLFIGSIAGKLFRESPCSVLGIHPNSSELPKSLMYACDFSNSNHKAFQEFDRLNDALEGPGTLYHIINPQSIRWEHQVTQNATTLESLMEQERSFALENFENMKKNMRSSDNIEVIIEETNETRPEFKIIENIEKNNIDLIIVGAHDYKGIKRILLGSTSQHIINNMPCTILVAK